MSRSKDMTAEEVREIRTGLEMTQAELARHLNMSTRSVKNLEQGGARGATAALLEALPSLLKKGPQTVEILGWTIQASLLAPEVECYTSEMIHVDTSARSILVGGGHGSGWAPIPERGDARDVTAALLEALPKMEETIADQARDEATILELESLETRTEEEEDRLYGLRLSARMTDSIAAEVLSYHMEEHVTQWAAASDSLLDWMLYDVEALLEALSEEHGGDLDECVRHTLAEGDIRCADVPGLVDMVGTALEMYRTEEEE